MVQVDLLGLMVDTTWQCSSFTSTLPTWYTFIMTLSWLQQYNHCHECYYYYC